MISLIQQFKSQFAMEGAGVKLKRVFAFTNTSDTDPFLLLDHFGSDNPDDYLAGFPWHPHRGIETVTYMLKGKVEHADSLNNEGTIGAGDVQWMTAGSGIVHQEMPKPVDGHMEGIQLWLNLPASHKMMQPRYREIKAASISKVTGAGSTVAVISGEYNGVKGSAEELVFPVEYYHVSLDADAVVQVPVKQYNKIIVYVLEGNLNIHGLKDALSGGNAYVLSADETMAFSAGNDSAQFMVMLSSSLNEPIAWRGPIVMNTQKELNDAFEELYQGTFLKDKPV